MNEIRKTPFGTEFWFTRSNRKILVFWGNRNANLETLTLAYPQIRFVLNQQVHGVDIHQVNHLTDKSSRKEGDGLWTKEFNTGLCVVTADCLPILLFSESSSLIVALHAGWRGVASRILPKLLAAPEICDVDHWQVCIGPHIQETSFEIGADVYQQIVQSQKLGEFEILNSVDPLQKTNLNLYEVVRSQAREFPEIKWNFMISSEDTCQCLDYHSFRRDREKAGRQIHFIAQFE